MAIDSQKILLGVLAIISTIGGNQVALDLSDNCKNLIETFAFREIVVFAIAYLATTDFETSIVIVIIEYCITKILLKDSPYFKERD